MRLSVTTLTTYAYPDARPVRAESGSWYVALGESALPVLPVGLDFADGWGDRPNTTMLSMTLHEGFEQLRDVAILSGEEAAEALARHCREFSAPILCRHGLPRRHPYPALCPDAPTMSVGGSIALWVEDITRMLTSLDGIEALAYHLATQRKPATKRMVENALAWPILPEWLVATIRPELERDGYLWVGRARQIVALSVSESFRQSSLELTCEWSSPGRPELVLEGSTELAPYMADFARHIGVVTDEDHSVTCVVCNQPYRPGRAPQPGATYCTQPECQKERKRRNQQQSRARRRATQDV